MEKKNMPEALKKIWEFIKKSKYVLVVILLGVVLISLPKNDEENMGETAISVQEEFSLSKEEQRIAKALSKIDGAGEVKRFFKITLPLISPTIFYLLIMGLIGALQEFTRFQVMTPDGGPEYQGLTVVFYLYKQLFNASGGSNLGIASAMGWIIAVLISIVTVLNFGLQRKWVNYD